VATLGWHVARFMRPRAIIMSLPSKQYYPPLPDDDSPQEHRARGKGLLRVTGSPLNDEIKSYLTDLLSAFQAVPQLKLSAADRSLLAQDIFTILTHRQFCHLSRANAAPYREHAVGLLNASLGHGGPIRFWYDIGPGYHASIRPGTLEPSFNVGFSELMILYQIAQFSRRIAAIYSPGVHFSLVVDNLCALRTNDIAVERTAEYCRQFRALIAEIGLEGRVSMVIESEEFDVDTYDRMLAALKVERLAVPPADDDAENVMRFLGRRCTPEEVLERLDKYRRTCVVTEQLLAGVVNGVRMTQRASATTLGFRPFPGGDSRTQCGEVALARNSNGKLHPVLLTSRSIDNYVTTRHAYPGQLPSLVPYVIYAEHVSA
jgi:hypothetical protein